MPFFEPGLYKDILKLEQKPSDTNRRQFLGQVLQLGCLACLNPSKLCSTVTAEPNHPVDHKFKAESKFTYEQVFGIAFTQQLIPNLKAVADQIGKDKLIEIIKKSNEERSFESGKLNASKLENPNLDSFISWHRNPDHFWKHVITYSVVEDTPQVFEARFTECIWANAVQKTNHSDIGYAAICHGDFAYAEGFSPKLKLIRTKTLMQGDDCCNHKYVWSD